MCNCIIKHAETREEALEILDYAKYLKEIGDAEGLYKTILQLLECPASRKNTVKNESDSAYKTQIQLGQYQIEQHTEHPNQLWITGDKLVIHLTNLDYVKEIDLSDATNGKKYTRRRIRLKGDYTKKRIGK